MGLVSQSLLLVFLLLGEEAAAGRFLCPTKTTLGTFNTGLVPFYPGLDPDGDPEIEERVALLIEQVCKNNFPFHSPLESILFFRSKIVMWTFCACKKYFPLTFSDVSIRS